MCIIVENVYSQQQTKITTRTRTTPTPTPTTSRTTTSTIEKKTKQLGLVRDLNPGPLAP